MTYVLSGRRWRGMGEFGTGASDLRTVSPAEFMGQVNVARVALAALAGLSKTLQLTTTDVALKEAARLSLDYAKRVGPARLDQNTPLALAAVQGATRRIASVIAPEVVPSVIERFLLLPIMAITGSSLSAEQIDRAKETKNEIVDEALDKLRSGWDLIPWWVAPAAGLFVVAYFVRAFR